MPSPDPGVITVVKVEEGPTEEAADIPLSVWRGTAGTSVALLYSIMVCATRLPEG